MDVHEAIDIVAEHYLPSGDPVAAPRNADGEWVCPHCGHADSAVMLVELAIETHRWTPAWGVDKSYDNHTLASVTTCLECEQPIEIEEG